MFSPLFFLIPPLVLPATNLVRSFTWRNATLAAPAPQCKMYATMSKNGLYRVPSDSKDFYFFDNCVESCSGPPPANATERFTRVPQKVPKSVPYPSTMHAGS